MTGHDWAWILDDHRCLLLAVLPDVLAAHPWSEAGHRALRGLLTGEGGGGVDGAFLGHARLAAAMLTMAAAPPAALHTGPGMRVGFSMLQQSQHSSPHEPLLCVWA